MILDKSNVKIFLEGIDISDKAGSFTLNISQSSPPHLQLTIAGSKNINKIVASTLIHVFIKSLNLKDEWYLLFEGELYHRNIRRTDSSDNVTLQFRSTSSLYINTYHTNYGYAQYVDGITNDVLYGNVGLQGNNTGEIKTNSPGQTINNWLFITEWNKWIQKSEADGVTNATEQFLKESYTTIERNSPFVKIINDSLRIKERIAIFKNDKMFDSVKKLEVFKDLNATITSTNILESYENMFNRILTTLLMKKIYLGIPCKVNGKITDSLIVPTTEACAPSTFNILYPDEFSNYTFNIDFTNDPTRALHKTYGAEFVGALGFNNVNIFPRVLSPSSELLLETSSSFLKFTEEEKYRGIRPISITSAPLLHSAYIWLAKDKKIDDANLFNDSIKAFPDLSDNEKLYLNTLILVGDYTFYTKKLDARGVGDISLPYLNTSWLVGFPGVIITPDHGSVIVNFSSLRISYNNNNGSISTAISISQPRFENDLMDIPTPSWFEDIFTNSNIGKDFYSQFNLNKLDSSILSYTKKDTNEEAVKVLENHKIKEKYRERALITNKEYFSFLNVKTNDGFPSLAVTEYRESSTINALQIASSTDEVSTPLNYLQCPFIYERAIKVAEWLGINKSKIKKYTVGPPAVDVVSLERSFNVDFNTVSLYVSATLIEKLKVYEAYIKKASTTYNVSENLIKGVLLAENQSFDTKSTTLGAYVGLMQIGVPAAKDAGFNVTLNDLKDPYTNIMAGTAYLAKMIRDLKGNEPLAVAAYNAGIGKVQDAGYTIPNTVNKVGKGDGVTTKQHVTKVFGYKNFLDSLL